MKKNIFTKLGIVFGLGLCSLTANAQEETATVDKSATTITNDGKANGFSIEYMGIEKATGINMDLGIGYFSISGGYVFGETNDNVTDNNSWHIAVGANYRYWLHKRIFIEGKIGIGYSHSTFKMKYTTGYKTDYIMNGKYSYNKPTYETSEESSGDVFGYITPRIGFNVGKIWDTQWAIVAGYRWDALKFKFDKDNTRDYFTIGITAGF